MNSEQSQNNHLFEQELNVLSAAKQLLEQDELKPEVLREGLQSLIQQYDKLLWVTRKIFSISDLQGNLAKKYEMELNHLLDHASQGFLSFGSDLFVQKQYSAECKRIFGGPIHQEFVPMLLWQGDERFIYQPLLKELFTAETSEEREAVIEKLPSMITIRNKFIHAAYKPLLNTVSNDSEQMKVMLILTDVTERISETP